MVGQPGGREEHHSQLWRTCRSPRIIVHYLWSFTIQNPSRTRFRAAPRHPLPHRRSGGFGDGLTRSNTNLTSEVLCRNDRPPVTTLMPTRGTSSTHELTIHVPPWRCPPFSLVLSVSSANDGRGEGRSQPIQGNYLSVDTPQTLALPRIPIRPDPFSPSTSSFFTRAFTNLQNHDCVPPINR